MSTIAVTARLEVASERSPRARSSLVRGGVGLGLATLTASAANYASNVLLGRRLEEREFADSALVVSGLLLLSAVALGLQLTVARGVANGGGLAIVRRVQRRAVIVGVGVGCALTAASPLIAAGFNMESATPVAVLSLGVPIFFSMAVRRGVLQATHRFGHLAISQVVEPLTRLAVTMVALMAGLGVSSAAIGLVVAFGVGWLACSPRAIHYPATSPDRANARSAIGATVLLLIGQVVIANGDLWVVSALIPSDAGIYAAIALVGRLVFIAAWSIVTVVFPSLVSGTRVAGTDLLVRAVAATAAVGALLTLGAALAGDRLIDGMVGHEYSGAGSLLWPYACATTLFVMANLLAIADVAQGRCLLPTLVTAGAITQALLLAALAQGGIALVVWGQLAAMALLFLVLAAMSWLRHRQTSRHRAPGESRGSGFEPAMLPRRWPVVNRRLGHTDAVLIDT